jgi:hypothetical protein
LTTQYARPDRSQSSGGSKETDRVRVIRDGVASYLPDIDPDETSEWLESFDDLLSRSGPARARYLMLRLLERAGSGDASTLALLYARRVVLWPNGNPDAYAFNLASPRANMARKNRRATCPGGAYSEAGVDAAALALERER